MSNYKEKVFEKPEFDDSQSIADARTVALHKMAFEIFKEKGWSEYKSTIAYECLMAIDQSMKYEKRVDPEKLINHENIIWYLEKLSGHWNQSLLEVSILGAGIAYAFWVARGNSFEEVLF